jgi:hypothetical protein
MSNLHQLWQAPALHIKQSYPHRHETALTTINSLLQLLFCWDTAYHQATCFSLQEPALSFQATCYSLQGPALSHRATSTYSGRNQLYHIEQHLPIQAGISSFISSNIYQFRQKSALSRRATSTYSGRNQLYHIEQHLPTQVGISSIISSNIYLFRQETALPSSNQATYTNTGRNHRAALLSSNQATYTNTGRNQL